MFDRWATIIVMFIFPLNGSLPFLSPVMPTYTYIYMQHIREYNTHMLASKVY